MRILFVCTGNIFRSMTAEYALNAIAKTSGMPFVATSAGTRDAPTISVRKDVAAYLESRGLDVSRHRRRTIAQADIANADLVVAMDHKHSECLKNSWSFEPALFRAICGHQNTCMPDVDEVLAPGEYHSEAAEKHIKATIDLIIDSMPNFVAAAPGYANRAD